MIIVPIHRRAVHRAIAGSVNLLAIAVLTSPAIAGPNSNAALVLHAVRSDYSTACDIDDPCLPFPGHPQVEIVEPGQPHAVYVLLRNFDNVFYLQFALDWPQDWGRAFGWWYCQMGCICEQFPDQPGPVLGAYSCCFNCITGGASTVIGYMFFQTPSAGCISIVDAAVGVPQGTFVESCAGGLDIDPVLQRNRGRVCVGPGGVNACESPAPVESSTWGQVKRAFP